MPQTHVDTGNDVWTGDINKWLRIGGDLRFDGTVTQVPHTDVAKAFSSSRPASISKRASFPSG